MTPTAVAAAAGASSFSPSSFLSLLISFLFRPWPEVFRTYETRFARHSVLVPSALYSLFFSILQSKPQTLITPVRQLPLMLCLLSRKGEA